MGRIVAQNAIHRVKFVFLPYRKYQCKIRLFYNDVLPITSDFVKKEYLTYNSKHYVIKNVRLLYELEEKSKLMQNNKLFFRQNIFGIL